MEEDDTSILGQLKELAKNEGHTKETPQFERRVRQLQVIRCREMRGHYSCMECPAYDHCELIKRVFRDNRGISSEEET